MEKWIIVAIAAIIGIGSAIIFKANNPVEEAMELVIKEETGASINFDEVSNVLESLEKKKLPINPMMASDEPTK